MIDTKFVVGTKGLTRSGRSYKVVAHTCHEKFPVVAVIDGRKAESFTVDGGFFQNPGNGLDLVLPKREKTFFVNVYSDTVIVHDSESIAKRRASAGALVVAHKVVIELP